VSYDTGMFMMVCSVVEIIIAYWIDSGIFSLATSLGIFCFLLFLSGLVIRSMKLN